MYTENNPILYVDSTGYIPVSEGDNGQYIRDFDSIYMREEEIIPDITDQLNNLMKTHEEQYEDYGVAVSPILKSITFYHLVRNGGAWDLKNQPFWKDYDQFIYNGEII